MLLGLCCMKTQYVRPISNILFQGVTMPCLCSLLSQIFLLHVQFEGVTCTQVSTLLLREDGLGLQLAATISTQVSECLKSTLQLREDA